MSKPRKAEDPVRWPVPCNRCGQHHQTLTTRLSKLFSTRAARLGTLHELTKLAPVAIIAETLGYSPMTIERHTTDTAVAYAQYIAARIHTN